MYQRYYKQKKFGRIFSFVLVVGSGLGHYLKSSIGYFKNSVKIDNLVSYHDYIPDNCKNLLDDFKEIRDGNVKRINEILFGRKESEHEKLENFVKNNKWIFRDLIIDTKDQIYNNKEAFSLVDKNISQDEIKLIETYKLYKNIKYKF